MNVFIDWLEINQTLTHNVNINLKQKKLRKAVISL
jgi:hypothetical protein